MPTAFTLNRKQSREVDRIAIEEFGIPGIVLMENAGRITLARFMGGARLLIRRKEWFTYDKTAG